MTDVNPAKFANDVIDLYEPMLRQQIADAIQKLGPHPLVSQAVSIARGGCNT
jgi:hypothetical protein